MPNVLFIVRQPTHAPRDSTAHHPGGAELTDQAIINDSPWKIDVMLSRYVQPTDVEAHDIIILSNLDRLHPATKRTLIAHSRHVMFEHDMRICRCSGAYWRVRDPWHRYCGRCICPHLRWQRMFRSARGTVFLTQLQRDRYFKNPFFSTRKTAVLGSSAFDENFFDSIKSLAHVPKTVDTCIVYSKRPDKGFVDALKYCELRGIRPTVIKDMSPSEMLQRLAETRRLVFLPRWYEAASRLAVEARFLGCELVLNDRVSVQGEPWWAWTREKSQSFVRDTPQRFWKIIQEMAVS